MAHRKSLVQVKFRIRQDVLRKLEREAKRHDRSVNDEIGRGLEELMEKREADRNTANVEELLFRSGYLTSMSKEGVAASLLGIASVGGPLGRRLSMAAITTDQGQTAALEWLALEQKAATIRAEHGDAVAEDWLRQEVDTTLTRKRSSQRPRGAQSSPEGLA